MSKFKIWEAEDIVKDFDEAIQKGYGTENAEFRLGFMHSFLARMAYEYPEIAKEIKSRIEYLNSECK